MNYDIVNRAAEFSRDFEVDPKQDNLEGILEKALEFLHEEVEETKSAVKENDHPEIIDGFGDVAFIALNGIYKHFRQHGEKHEEAAAKVKEVMKRICDANLGKKQPNGTIKYVNGKVQKPEGWHPPAYDDMVA